MSAARSVLTARDEAILEMVFSYDGVAIHHIQQRFFPTPGARSACYTRIGALVKAGYLTASRIPSQTGLGTGKAFLTTAPKARALLARLRGITMPTLGRGARVHSPMLLEHHLAICDVRLLLELAVAANPGFATLEWTTEHLLRSKPLTVTDARSGEAIPLIPDGRLRLVRADRKVQTFFVELDRGTITEHQRLRKRLRGYLLQARATPTPVLFIVPTAARLALLVSLAEQEAGKLAADPTIFLLVEQQHLLADTVLTAPVWTVAGIASPLAIGPTDQPAVPLAQKGASG